jgi:hypothetical protein
MTGIKANYYTVGVDGKAKFGNCSSIQNAKVKGMLHWSQVAGMLSSLMLHWSQITGMLSSLMLHWSQTAGMLSSLMLHWSQTAGMLSSLIYTGLKQQVCYLVLCYTGLKQQVCYLVLCYTGLKQQVCYLVLCYTGLKQQVCYLVFIVSSCLVKSYRKLNIFRLLTTSVTNGEGLEFTLLFIGAHYLCIAFICVLCLFFFLVPWLCHFLLVRGFCSHLGTLWLYFIYLHVVFYHNGSIDELHLRRRMFTILQIFDAH